MDFQRTKPTFDLGGKQFQRLSWWKEPGMRGLYIRLFFVILTSATNGYDGSMMNGLQSLKQWQNSFHHPSAPKLGLLNCIMSVGSLVALPSVPYIADILGRRSGVFIGCSIMVLGVTLQSIGINFGIFVAGRFFIGFGVAIAHGSSPLLLTELVHPQHRAIYTTIYNCNWYLGSIVAAWLTYGTNSLAGAWAWRTPSLVQALPSLLQILMIWTVPESPRWLISKGQNEKALNILAKYHARGDAQDEVVQIEYQEIQQTLALEQEFEGNSWSELWRTPGNRHRLLILISLGVFSQWSGNGLVSYYIFIVLQDIGIENSKTQLEINGILQIVNFAVALFMCFMVDRIGRRKLFLTATAGMMCSFMVWTACSAQFTYSADGTSATGPKSDGRAVIATIFIYYVFYNTAWSGLLVGYAVEILPYNIRAKGMTILWLAIDAVLFFNQYVNPIALRHLHWKYYIVYTVWLAFETFIVWKFYIETRNTPLEEIVKHFDGEGALVGGVAANEKSRQLAAEIDLDIPGIEHHDPEKGDITLLQESAQRK